MADVDLWNISMLSMHGQPYSASVCMVDFDQAKVD
jgi:hypothetical protein